jgi:hypothetical protein
MEKKSLYASLVERACKKDKDIFSFFEAVPERPDSIL